MPVKRSSHTNNQIEVSRKAVRIARKDLVKGAEAIELQYVTDADEGYRRHRSGKGFYYTFDGKRVSDKATLGRIKKLVIPPAWNQVWICKLPNGHLQVTGVDALHRKQYRYHPKWNLLRNHTKFYSLLEFGKQLPAVRAALQQHLSLPGFPQHKVLAAVVSLIDRTGMRIGNQIYEKLYGSFGLTTMHNKHAKIEGSALQFTFTGKKGIKQHITLKSKKLARIIKGCKEIPGKKLFEYYDEQGEVHQVDSGMVNSYIRDLTSKNYTAKDFRTWNACSLALAALREAGEFENEAERKSKLNKVLSSVAKELGNTVAVCKNYYVHPLIIELYDQKKLQKYMAEEQSTTTAEDTTALALEEAALLKILARM